MSVPERSSEISAHCSATNFTSGRRPGGLLETGLHSKCRTHIRCTPVAQSGRKAFAACPQEPVCPYGGAGLEGVLCLPPPPRAIASAGRMPRRTVLCALGGEVLAWKSEATRRGIRRRMHATPPPMAVSSSAWRMASPAFGASRGRLP